MKKQKLLPYLFLHILLFVFSCGGIFSKKAAGEDLLSLKWILLYGCLIAVLGIYAVGWQQLLKHIPLNIAYVNKSVTLIWAMIFGAVIFDEKITPLKVAGAALVVAGSLLITIKRDDKEGKP